MALDHAALDPYEEAMVDTIRSAYPSCTDWQVEQKLYELDRMSEDKFTQQMRLMIEAGERNKRESRKR